MEEKDVIGRQQFLESGPPGDASEGLEMGRRHRGQGQEMCAMISGEIHIYQRKLFEFLGLFLLQLDKYKLRATYCSFYERIGNENKTYLRAGSRKKTAFIHDESFKILSISDDLICRKDETFLCHGGSYLDKIKVKSNVHYIGLGNKPIFVTPHS